MERYEAEAQLLRIEDLHRAAAAERQARQAVRTRRERKHAERTEGRVGRHRARWARAA